MTNDEILDSMISECQGFINSPVIISDFADSIEGKMRLIEGGLNLNYLVELIADLESIQFCQLEENQEKEAVKVAINILDFLKKIRD